jgi:cytochrome c
MISSRLIGLSVLCAALALVAGCNKQPAAPPTTATPSAAPPAPAPATPAQPAPAASSSSVPASGANDQSAEQLANKSGCLACHAVDKKIVGPAYKEVAEKYRGQPDAEAKLVQKVKNGGSGAWGQVPMPPNTQVKDEDIKTLVHWILSLK